MVHIRWYNFCDNIIFASVGEGDRDSSKGYRNKWEMREWDRKKLENKIKID